MNEQPEALQLADWLDDLFDSDGQPKQAAAELRRLHAEVEQLRAQPALQPLTDKEIETIIESMPGSLIGLLKTWGWQQFTRAIERAHGIGGEA